MTRGPASLNRKRQRVLVVAMIAMGLALNDSVGTLNAQETTPPDNVAEEEKDSKKEKKSKGPSFIPIPVFITEPAIGYGLGAALAYFHPRKDEADDPSVAPAVTTGTPPAQGADKVKKRPPHHLWNRRRLHR